MRWYIIHSCIIYGAIISLVKLTSTLPLIFMRSCIDFYSFGSRGHCDFAGRKRSAWAHLSGRGNRSLCASYLPISLHVCSANLKSYIK